MSRGFSEEFLRDNNIPYTSRERTCMYINCDINGFTQKPENHPTGLFRHGNRF